MDYICTELAKKIARDGEGATKLMQVNVKNAATDEDAKKIAKAVVSSNLVKCAVYGNDPNWGRIMCAAGNSGAKFDQEKIDIYFDNEAIVKNGTGVDFNYEQIKKIMGKENLDITLNLKNGNKNATAYGCDMTEEYIKINALYTT